MVVYMSVSGAYGIVLYLRVYVYAESCLNVLN
jgi:hypothetical protein